RLLTRGGESVTLAPKTYELLLLLVQSEGRALSKQELMSALWVDTFVEEANLSFQISTLRKALGEAWIETVPRHGYRFAARVTTEGPPPSQAPDPPRRWIPWMVAALATLVAVAVSVAHFRERPQVEQPVRFLI